MSRLHYVRPAEQTELHLVNECLIRLRAHRLHVYITVAAALVISIAAAALSPRSFPAQAKVMPSPTNPSGSSLSALIPGAAMLSQAATQINLYLELLKSSPLQDSVLAHFDIDPRGRQRAVDKLPSGHSVGMVTDAVSGTFFSANMKSGVVTITSAAADPRLSANIANAFTYRLDERLQELERSLATRTSGYLAGQISEQRTKLQEIESRRTDLLAHNRNYLISDDPQLRVEMERLEMDVQFGRELLKTLLEIKATNDLELEKSIPRLLIVEWASTPEPQFPFSRIKTVLLATLGTAVFAVGLIVLRTTWLWYVPPTTRAELAQSCTTVGVDARRAVNRIRRLRQHADYTGV